MLGNRQACKPLAEAFEVPWRSIGDTSGNPMKRAWFKYSTNSPSTM